MSNGADNGWSEWRKFVLKELERLSALQEKTNEKLADIRTETTSLKTRVGFIATVSAIIASAVVTAALRLLSR